MSDTMFKWNKKFEIQNDTIDAQHHELFVLLNSLADDVAKGNKSREELQASLDFMVKYANQHFVDEEKIMEEYQVDTRHIKMQKMEHRAFLSDLEKIKSWTVDDKLSEKFERLISFTTAWLVFHTLKVDQELGLQLREIQKGTSPEVAYELSRKMEFSTHFYRNIVHALIHLWTDAADRATQLESVVATYEKMLKKNRAE